MNSKDWKRLGTLASGLAIVLAAAGHASKELAKKKEEEEGWDIKPAPKNRPAPPENARRASVMRMSMRQEPPTEQSSNTVGCSAGAPLPFDW